MNNKTIISAYFLDQPIPIDIIYNRVEPITQTTPYKMPPRPVVRTIPDYNTPVIVHIFSKTFDSYLRIRTAYINEISEGLYDDKDGYNLSEKVYKIVIGGQYYLFFWKRLTIDDEPTGDVALVQDKYVSARCKNYIVKNYKEVVFSNEP